MAEGLCEVSYWLDAEFRLNSKQVGYLSKHVEVPSFYSCLQASIERPVHFPLKVASDWLWGSRHGKTANFSLLLQQIERRPTVYLKTKEFTCASFSLGMTLKALGIAGITLPWDTRQSLKCYINCKWEAKVSFSPIQDHGNMKAEHGRLIFEVASPTSTERHTVYFRPETKLVSSNYYVAMSELDLSLPEFIQQPSCQFGLLSREYTLKLSLAFDKIGGISLPEIQKDFSVDVKPVGVCADAVYDEVTVGGTLDSCLQNDEELSKEAAVCRSQLPIYC